MYLFILQKKEPGVDKFIPQKVKQREDVVRK